MEQSGAHESTTAQPQTDPPQTDAASRNILVPIDDHEVSADTYLHIAWSRRWRRPRSCPNRDAAAVGCSLATLYQAYAPNVLHGLRRTLSMHYVGP